MDDRQTKYYSDMLSIGRGHLVTKHDHVIAIVTYLIGSDDEKYLTKRIPWTLIDDNPDGETLYIDQLIVKGADSSGYIHREFGRFLGWAKEEFKNIKQVKWMRVNADFRKHGNKEGVKANVHCKNITR